MNEQLNKLDGNELVNVFPPKFLGDPFHRLDFKWQSQNWATDNMPHCFINDINMLDGIEKLWKIKKITMSNELIRKYQLSPQMKTPIFMVIKVIINLLENSWVMLFE